MYTVYYMNLLKGLGHIHDEEHTQSKSNSSSKWKDNCKVGRNTIDENEAQNLLDNETLCRVICALMMRQ